MSGTGAAKGTGTRRFGQDAGQGEGENAGRRRAAERRRPEQETDQDMDKSTARGTDGGPDGETGARTAGAANDPAADRVQAGDAAGRSPGAPSKAAARPGPARHKAAAKTKAAAPQPAPVVIQPIAGPARVRRRHWGLGLTFVLMVLLPVLATVFYLWTRAADQYASSMGFTVRSEEISSPMELLGGLTGVSGASASDTDILYEFIQSQELVRQVDADVDLRAAWGRPWPDDPVFALDPAGSIEDLLDHWLRMVRIAYDASTGLIELRVLAFTPEEAQAIARAIFTRSGAMINELSAIAREDAMRYAREDLEGAVERLKTAREAVTEYRSRTQIVDPAADIQGQMGILATLQEQLAAALIESDLLRETTQSSDPRVAQAERRIAVIERRIVDERRKFGVGGEGPGGADYATLVAEYERLAVDREFAEEAYTAALAAFDAARAEAQRQSRYLAAFVRPTLAEVPEYPNRLMLTGLVALFSVLAWAILSLVYYSLRDRR